jgi:hypothetical protein
MGLFAGSNVLVKNLLTLMRWQVDFQILVRTPLANIAGLEHLTKTYEICDKKHIKLSKDSILI